VTGRDVEEQELALRFEPLAGAWTLLGDAAAYKLGETRRELLEAIRAHGTLTPKQAAEEVSVNYELVKKTLQRMAADGQLDAKEGRYSFRTPVPPVPLSLDAEEDGDKGTAGTLLLRDADA
jgi:predicted transcriptional regulator